MTPPPHYFTVSALILSGVFLSACGGSDNGVSGVTTPPEDTNTSALEWEQELLDLERTYPEEVKATFHEAATSPPQFGSVTQSGSSLGGTGGKATASYDRNTNELSVTIDRFSVKTAGFYNNLSGDIEIDSVDLKNTANGARYGDSDSPQSGTSWVTKRKTTFNAWGGWARSFVLFDREVSGPLGDYSPATTWVVVTVEHPDDNDYLIGGYWLRTNGDGVSTSSFGGGNEFTSAEVGAFVDGYGFDSDVPLPNGGTASYEGSAHGLAYSYDDGSLIGHRDYTWSKDMNLTAISQGTPYPDV